MAKQEYKSRVYTDRPAYRAKYNTYKAERMYAPDNSADQISFDDLTDKKG